MLPAVLSYLFPFVITALGCIGALVSTMLLVGLVEPKYRTHSLNALRFGVLAGIPPALVVFNAKHLPGDLNLGAVRGFFVGLVFFAGFAIGILWYALRFRSARRAGSSNNRWRGP